MFGKRTMESRRRVSWNTESAAASNGEWEGETSSRRPRCSAPRRQEQACWPVARRKAHPKHRLRPRLRQPGGLDPADVDWKYETDVVIVGSGSGGTCAAIEAAEAGADVVVFEIGRAHV